MKNQYQNDHDIFNGKFKIITEENEFRMSHWVKGFGIFDNTNNDWILELNRSFPLDTFEELEKTLKINFRISPNGSVQYEINIDPFNKIFTYNHETYNIKDFVDTFMNHE